MHERNPHRPEVLDLRVGEWVEVRSQDEILATLDEHGRLGNLPFMSEMFQYCGKRFRVFKRADKTCDYIQRWSIRRMKDSVHLEGLRCDGTGHEGCQAGCLIFWKEAWLKRAASDVVSAESLRVSSGDSAGVAHLCTVENILASSHSKNSEGELIYSCQATDVPRARGFGHRFLQ